MERVRRRSTIGDVAARTGLSVSAVSLALNGRAGVSEATRARVVAAADELGWRPSAAARSLSGARAGAVGLVVARPARTLGTESFFGDLIAGIQSGLGGSRTAMLLAVAEDTDAETEVYRDWWAGRRVDGVLLIDPQARDPRLALLAELGLPAVVLGARPGDEGGAPTVWSDDAGAARSVFGYLSALGHRRIAHVTGPAAYEHTALRRAALEALLRSGGLEEAETLPTDYSEAESARTTRGILMRADRPSAIVYDNDVQAAAGLGVAAEMGVEVPLDLSVASFDDSVTARLMRPAVTALARDTMALGEQALHLLLAEIAHRGRPSERGPDPVLVPRGSTAPPRRAAL